jgi:A/G-specific adenine glycosylase
MSLQEELENKKQFTRLLGNWNRKKNTRKMPWKGEKDPYKIWLSEIILQQTRVEQGLSYYHRFIETFPSIHHLAKAPDNKVFKLWEGLGYYTRCKNLIATARHISGELKGKFPESYAGLRSLKGVGPYTAAAIASFAFQLPYAVVDGNVFRVLSRVFGIKKPVDTTEGKVFFTELANTLIDKKQPGLYNQAIMDFGALVCKPVAPLCNECPFSKFCYAFTKNRIRQLPVKEKRKAMKKRLFYYLVIEHGNEWLISQRTGKDIWRQLFEFPMIETKKTINPELLPGLAAKKYRFRKKSIEIISLSPVLKQKLSHQLIKARFIYCRINQKPHNTAPFKWVHKKHLSRYAFPKIINDYLQFLNLVQNEK